MQMSSDSCECTAAFVRQTAVSLVSTVTGAASTYHRLLVATRTQHLFSLTATLLQSSTDPTHLTTAVSYYTCTDSHHMSVYCMCAVPTRSPRRSGTT